MKIVSLLLSLCLACVALAEEPAELERLRQQWEQSVAQEMEKRNKIYLKALEKLQKKFTGANNLAAAVAVNDEVQKVKAMKPQQKRTSPLDGVWIETIPGLVRPNWLRAIKGGKMAIQNSLMAECSIKKSVLTIRGGSNVWILKVDPDNPDVMEGTIDGAKTTWTRVKW